MYTPKLKNTDAVEFVLNQYTRGYAQCIDNNWNFAVYAQDPTVSIYQNEYNAGYVQAKVQTPQMIKATRNNTWRWYVLDEGPGANSVTPPDNAIPQAEKALADNYNYLVDYVDKHKDYHRVQGIIRLMYRMLGIYHGAADKARLENVSFDDLRLSSMAPEELKMNSDDQPITFIDIYLLNAQMDLWDAMSKELGIDFNDVEMNDESHKLNPDHCSGFVKKLDDGEIIWAHTSWCCMYAQSCAMTYVIGQDFITQNQFCPGQFGSNTDFGFNGHGIGFNETTETDFYNESKIIGIWLTWRAAAAEHYATSIDDFYEYLSMDNTGTYLSAYMLVDAYKGEFGMVDMSYARFALFKGDGTKLTVKESTDYQPNFLDYDHHMATENYILGCNIPVYKRIWRDLNTIDGAPKRRFQLYTHIGTVYDIHTAKKLITFNSDNEPISISGRWDLNYGTSEFLRYQPHGAIDAKTFSASLIKEVLASLSMKPSKDGTKTSFWMKFGSAYLAGTPFIWSRSVWAKFKQPEEVDYVPDAIDGRWNRVKMFME